ncbi:hypothetical protein [Candidatus Borrarchaeum sp.]|uniref:hypothetical protein n=1 Tax=Candidatus Borrarchaeum sp. TaxID=2846742 RepID=UPI00257DF804|nr:hypothetical protein [Candidatus Borrarchaeum sp.]
MSEKQILEEKIKRLLKLSREAMSLSSEIFRDVVAPKNVLQKFTEVVNGIGLATKILTGQKIELPKEFLEKKKIEVE